MINRLSFPSILRHLINKPPRWLVCRLSMASGEIVGKKEYLAEKRRLRGYMRNFENNLETEDIISHHTSKPESDLFIFKPCYNFSISCENLLLKKLVQSDSGFIFALMQYFNITNTGFYKTSLFFFYAKWQRWQR